MAKPLYSSGRVTLKSAKILIDDSFLDFFTTNFFKRNNIKKELEKSFKKALVQAATSVKSQINMMNAVATGFMRKNVTYSMDAVWEMGKEAKIIGIIGTRAWYDILVHEGLGRHGGQSTIPSRYHPTPEQLAIVEPDEKTRKKYYKASPKIPRPFLVNGIKLAKRKIKTEMMTGIKKAIKQSKGRIGTPIHDISAILGGGRF